MKQSKPKCVQVRNLMSFQMNLFMKHEFLKHQQKLSQLNGQNIDLDEAKDNYIGSSEQNIYCAGLKAAYCQNHCLEDCSIKYDKKTPSNGDEKISRELLKQLNGNNLHHCSHLEDIVREQEGPLIEEIKKHKYYLSEKENHDIGWDLAAQDFVDKLLPKWIEGFEATYCNTVCLDRYDCQKRFEKVDVQEK